MEEAKINVRNIIVGIILMCGCVYVGAMSAMPHQSELVTKAINIPAQFTAHKDVVTEESVTMALNQSDNGVLNTEPLIDAALKIIIIVGVVSVIFLLLQTTGLTPRFGGMGD